MKSIIMIIVVVIVIISSILYKPVKNVWEFLNTGHILSKQKFFYLVEDKTPLNKMQSVNLCHIDKIS